MNVTHLSVSDVGFASEAADDWFSPRLVLKARKVDAVRVLIGHDDKDVLSSELILGGDGQLEEVNTFLCARLVLVLFTVCLRKPVKPPQLFVAIVIHVGEFVLWGQQPAVVVAGAVADDVVRVVGVVGREGAAGAVVGARAVQHGAAVILEIFGRRVAVCLAVVIFCCRTVAPVLWHESRGDVGGIVGGDESSR